MPREREGREGVSEKDMDAVDDLNSGAVWQLREETE